MHRAAISEDGFTIVEVLLAMIVLVVGVLGVFLLVDTANSTTTRSLAREGGTTLARDLVERSRQVPFASHGGSDFGERLRLQVADTVRTTAVDGSTFRVPRRGSVTYTATAASCKVDDPSDGVGVHDATFCDFAVPPGGGNPEPGAPPAVSATLKLLGIPLKLTAGGTLLDSVCGLLGANPLGSVAALDSLLGRGGTVNSVLALVNSGADVNLCPATTTGEQFAFDTSAADFSKVTVTVSWTPVGQPAQTLRQSSLIANPSGV